MSIDVVHQHILSDPYPRSINLHHIPAEDAARHVIKRRSTEQEDLIPIGISYHVGQTGDIDLFCLANLTDAYILEFDPKSSGPRQVFTALLCAAGDEIDLESLSPSHRPCLVGFGMARTAIQVNRTTHSRVRGVDLSTLSLINIREAKSPSAFIAERIDSRVDKFAIIRLWMNFEGSAERDIVLQAWLAACAGTQSKQELRAALKVDTNRINFDEKVCLSHLVGQCDMIDIRKPKEVHNEFEKVFPNGNQKFIQILNARYKTRIRKGGDQTEVRIRDADDTVFKAKAIRVHGRVTTLACSSRAGKFPSTNPQELKVFGRPESTNHEKAREEFIFLVLTAGITNLRRSPFVRMLWFPQQKPLPLRQTHIIDTEHADNMKRTMGLNDSQATVTRAMIGDSAVTIVHGPPGTGKTTTIAAACKIWDQLQLPVWVVAHSNVAVKNIAKTLCKKEINFKLIVSKEFYEEWHEHIYESLAARVIRSDRLPPNQEGMRRVISNSSIILCTLSMLSNPVLAQNGTFEVVRPNRLLVDEASQINVFDFMHLFVKFQGTLEKLCFFGDPMQLPPFGQEDVPSIQTVFDLKHLGDTDNCHFLQMQYRMPKPIATFISRFVYGEKLLTRGSDRNPDCLAFIHAPGKEEPQGSSKKNTGEIDTIVNLVKIYYREQKGFCVITPYDAQRAAIPDRLRREGLPWNSVYNVDSFQGHEEDYVIVSVVRTSRAGFLNSQNRMNVMLTRCRKGLIIVSNKIFLGPYGNGHDTLLGKLSTYWEECYPGRTWIESGSIANGPDARASGRVAPIQSQRSSTNEL